MTSPLLPRSCTRSLMLLVSMTLFACGKDDVTVKPLAAPVRVITLATADAGERITASGQVRAAIEAPLAFKTPGIVAQLSVTAGQRVKAGQSLAALDTRDLDAALAQGRENLAKTERDLVRINSLRDKGMVSQQASQDIRAQRDVAKVALAASEFNRQQAVITAPSDGVILEKRVEARETVAAGMPIIVFGRLDRGWVVRAGLPARDALRLAVGEMAQVRIDGQSESMPARIERIAAASDARTGTVEVELALPKSTAQLVSGMLARVEIRKGSDAAGVLIVPLSAVLEGNAGAAKLFVLEGEKVRRVDVRTGRLLDGGRIEIVDGITAGVKIVSEGAAWLDDGASVRVLP
jgi:RND family efflux transporter MFP subunit